MKAYSFPSADSPAHYMIDLDHFAEIVNPKNRAKLDGLDAARKSARRFLKANPSVLATVRYVLHADGSLNLIEFSVAGEAKGESRVIWNFGKI